MNKLTLKEPAMDIFVSECPNGEGQETRNLCGCLWSPSFL